MNGTGNAPQYSSALQTAIAALDIAALVTKDTCNCNTNRKRRLTNVTRKCNIVISKTVLLFTRNYSGYCSLAIILVIVLVIKTVSKVTTVKNENVIMF